MERNIDLKTSLQLLSEKVLPIFEAHVIQGGEHARDTVLVAITLHQLKEGVKDIPEFKDALELMRSDDSIMALQGKLVGDASSRGLVEDEQTCLFSFLQQLYLDTNNFDQATFETKYAAFEDFFYKEHLKFRETSSLYRFESTETEIVLADGVRIVRRQPDTQGHDYGNFGLGHDFLISPFEIELIADRTKLVGDDKDRFKSAITEQQRVGICFDNVVTSLRILKSSGIYRSEEIKTEPITFHPMSGTSVRQPLHKTVATGEKCSLDASDIDELNDIYKHVESEKNTRFIVATRRLSSGNERPGLEDKLIDYMIGLEALYLPDGNQELSFRLGLRTALVLETEAKKQKETFNFVKQAYNTRSSIVHGSKYKLDETIIERVEGMLRLSIKKWIEDEDVFATNVKKNGILTKEGNLDNLFFS